tara:strand:+ start:297 stop:1163 length:867 start_codon:yes stop_codon:yes gene_type:complete
MPAVTVQAERGRWRWLDAFLTSAGTGIAAVLPPAANIVVEYKKYGDLALSTKTVDPVSTPSTTVALATAIGATQITLVDTSIFPPENGLIDLDVGGANEELAVQFTSNNTTTNTLTLSAALANAHILAENVRLQVWREVSAVNAPGHYMLLFNDNDLDTLDVFSYYIRRTAGPAFDNFFRTIDIIPREGVDSETTPSVPTCVIKDHVVDLQGNAAENVPVFARLLALPTLVSGVGVQDRTFSAVTDAQGFFQLQLIQGATVDITIPSTGYRRTLTVPSTTIADLFSIV